jgi:hypothetical protein
MQAISMAGKQQGNFCEATLALQVGRYHSLRAPQGSALSAMSVEAFGQ